MPAMDRKDVVSSVRPILLAWRVSFGLNVAGICFIVSASSLEFLI